MNINKKLKSVKRTIKTNLGLVPPKDLSIGVIDEVRNFMVRGWFIARHPDYSTNSFYIYLDNTQLGKFEATLPREDVLKAEGALLCGFEVDIEPALRKLPAGVHELHDGQQHQISIRTLRGRVISQKTVEGESPYRGFLDNLDSTGLHGWAIDVRKPSSPVELVVYVNGHRLLEIATDTARADLSKKGWSDNRAGFRIQWPEGLFEQGAQFDVRVKSTDQSLSKSPRRLEQGSSRPRTDGRDYLGAWREGRVRDVTIIVPIFNAYEAVRECIESVMENRIQGANLLLIDDCSTDERIGKLMQDYQGKPGVTILRNPVNLGYTKTVNRAIKEAGDNDVVLLNSDTVTTARWLYNLRYCAYAYPCTATVTALSDNAGAFSVPEIGETNKVPDHLTPTQFALCVTNSSPGRILEVPTGNGFCMYIRRDAINRIGLFDEEKYPRGYGEENDFCMRALRSGWRNFVCDKAFVFHKRSQSFKDEKAVLLEAGSRQLASDYPEYKLLTSYFRGMEFSKVRCDIRGGVDAESIAQSLPRILYVVATQTGGTPQTNLDLMRSLESRYGCFLLRCDSKHLVLSQLREGVLQQIASHVLERPIEPTTHRSAEYDAVVQEWMYRYAIRLVHIRHIAWHSLGAVDAAKAIGVPVVYSFHDYYALCPSLKLLDEDLRHCGGDCARGSGDCRVELWPQNALPPIRDRYIYHWRQRFTAFLTQCSKFVTTTESAAEQILHVFPEIRSRLVVIPHGRDFPEFLAPGRIPAPGNKVRVLVPGNISAAKGAKLIREMAGIDNGRRLEFIFLGSVDSSLCDIGTHFGSYAREDLQRIVADLKPHVAAIFSVWPETYCHTLTEMWSCGVPVVGLDIGAVGDRIRQSGAGWLLPASVDAQQALSRVIESVEDRAGFQERLAAVHRWQSTEALSWGVGHMAAEYRSVYDALLGSSDVFEVPSLGCSQANIKCGS